MTDMTHGRTVRMDREGLLDRFSVPAQVVIRRCVRSDLAELEWRGSFTEHRALIAEAFARHERGEVLMLVAEAAAFPVGQIWIDLERGAPGAAQLWAFRVLPCMRGLGIGSRLLTVAERAVRARGRFRAELGCDRSNPAARRFYEQRGYRLVREVVERYAYETPEGMIVHAVSDLWILRKCLAPRASEGGSTSRRDPA